MDKIKSVLSGHRKSEDVSRDSHDSSSTAAGQQHPIFDEMTGHHEGQGGSLTSAGAPYAQAQPTSGEPYTNTGGPLGSSNTSTGRPLDSSYTATGGHLGSSGATTGGPLDSSSTTTRGPIGSSGTTSAGHLRPDPNPTGKDSLNAGISSASIKSGVIGFGAGEKQEHAALPTHYEAEQDLEPSQVVGGGNLDTSAGDGQRDVRPNTESQALPYSSTTGHEPRDARVAGTSAQQPFEQSLRQESYTADTDRSFPLTGGVTSRHPEQTSTLPQTGISEREPGTKEREAGLRDSHGREGLAGAAAAATAVGASKTLGHSDERDVRDRGLGHDDRSHGFDREGPVGTTAATTTLPRSEEKRLEREEEGGEKKGGLLGFLHRDKSKKEGEEDVRDQGLQHHGHDREGLAGAAAATTAVGTSEHLSRSEEKRLEREEEGGEKKGGLLGFLHRDTSKKENEGNVVRDQDPHHHAHGREGLARDQGLETRQATYGDIPSTTTYPGGTTGPTTGHHHNPEAVAAATAAAAAAASRSSHGREPGYGTPDRTLPGTSSTGTTTGATSRPGTVVVERPHGKKSISYRHVPGGFPNTPGDESRTFLDYSPAIEAPSETSASGTTASGLTSGADTTTGQHELRHTGSLEQPTSRSSDLPGEHHYGRDAALAGGLGAGAVGLEHAASQKRDTANTGSKPLYEESSPYSSKTLDPRVMGAAKLEEQRFDPQAKAHALPHHAVQPSNPTGISAASGPAASHGTTRAEDPQHHYGRDAALVGAGAATAGGLHHMHQRNDTPGTGTSVLPPDTSNTSVPLSGSTAPQQYANTSMPLTSSAAPVPQQRSTGNDTFYGTSGAPAPVAGESSMQQPLGNVGYNSGPTTSATSTYAPQVPERDPQHHLGRDAALAGAGAATAGGVYAASHDDKTHTGPASKTIGPHDSNIANILDPRVQPDPSKQKEHTTTGPHQSDTLNRLDPRVNEKAGQQGEHHYGRDAAIAGGTGAAGYGAYEAAKAYDEHRSTQPRASMNEQRYDTAATGANTSNPVPTSGHYDYNDPSTTSNVNRDTALGTGAGLGAAGAGAGAYAGSKHADNMQHLPLHQKQDFVTSGQPGSAMQSGPTQGTIAPHNTQTQDNVYHQRYESLLDPAKQHHDGALLDPAEQHHGKRDAALGATAAGGAAYEYSKHHDADREPHSTHTQDNPSHQRYESLRDPAKQHHDKRDAALGTAAAGGAAYEYSKHHDADHEQARLEKEQQERLKREAHDREKEQHRLDKEHHKHDKEVAAAQHHHDKEVAAYEKEQHRLEKDELKREKEEEKAAHRHEKEEEPEKKGGLFGFLHRDKSKKERTSPEASPRQSTDYAHSKDHAALGAAGAIGAGTTAAAYEEHEGRNRLHKDPPPGHPMREALEHPHQGQGELGGKREHVGVDGPIGDPNLISGDRETEKGVFGAHDISDAGHNKTVIEPITGLPMNVGKFGPGTGGTDANPAIEGHHVMPTGVDANPAVGAHQSVPTGAGGDVRGGAPLEHHMLPGAAGNTSAIGGHHNAPTHIAGEETIEGADDKYYTGSGAGGGLASNTPF